MFPFPKIFPSWIWIRILNADPDPGRKMNADPCGSCSIGSGLLWKKQGCRSRPFLKFPAPAKKGGSGWLRLWQPWWKVIILRVFWICLLENASNWSLKKNATSNFFSGPDLQILYADVNAPGRWHDSHVLQRSSLFMHGLEPSWSKKTKTTFPRRCTLRYVHPKTNLLLSVFIQI